MSGLTGGVGGFTASRKCPQRPATPTLVLLSSGPGMATTDQVKQIQRSTDPSTPKEIVSLQDGRSSEIASPLASPEPYQVKNPVHRINAPGSVQALAVDDDVLFAGTQGGSIIVWSLETYQLLATVPAHKESVLSLALSEDRALLFSTGADSVVNVWSTQTLHRLYSLHSHFEIGDIFCVVHSTKNQTLFWGAQNSSIQWHKLSTDANVKSPILTFTPGSRKHRFFDSLGPGGIANIIYDEDGITSTSLNGHGGRVLTVPSQNYYPYAHKSYIYCMILVKGLFRHDRDEEVLVTAGGGAIRLWSIDELTSKSVVQMTKFSNPNSNIFSLAYKGSFLYAGLSDGVVNIYNLASNQLVQRLGVGHGDVSQVLVTTDSLLCGTNQGWVKVGTSTCEHTFG